MASVGRWFEAGYHANGGTRLTVKIGLLGKLRMKKLRNIRRMEVFRRIDPSLPYGYWANERK